MRSTRRCLGVFLAWGALCASASAQTAPEVPLHGGATTLTAFVGAHLGEASVEPLLGAGVGWRVTPRVSLEGTGLWVPDQNGAAAFAAALKSEVALASSQRVSPFLQAGVGLYLARFDGVDSAMPEFYRQRLARSPAVDGARVTFTDPTVVFGGGVNIGLNRRLVARPDLETQVVLRDAHANVVTTVRLHLVYYFEHHPVTPSNRQLGVGSR